MIQALLNLLQGCYRLGLSSRAVAMANQQKDSQDGESIGTAGLEAMEKSIEADHRSWLSSWFRWNPTSMKHIREAEDEIMKFATTPRRCLYVDIGAVVGTSSCRLWTAVLNERAHTERKPPLLLLHGFASGMALWCLNIDSLAANHTVYTIDMLGFGRSSRPRFSTDAEEVERQYVQSIEEWRKAMKIERMFLLGHSMGGYLAAAYALRHPESVDHLILADPWGFSDPTHKDTYKPRLPFWARAIVRVVGLMNPLSLVRLGGPWGSSIIEWARPDLIRKFSKLVVNPPDRNYIAEYIYHCNAQTPSGELAFHSLSTQMGWARNPMVHRIGQIDPDVPITCIHGSRSWIDDCSHQILAARQDSYVDCETLCDASHHVYADQPESFNSLVLASYDYPRRRWQQERPDVRQDEQESGDEQQDGESGE